MTYLLERQEGMGLSDDELAYLAGSMFGAGSDSVSLFKHLCKNFVLIIHETATAISFVMMAAATHPQAQSEVQAELDSVVGKDRGPLLCNGILQKPFLN